MLDPVRKARPDLADHLDPAAASAGLSLLYRGLTGPTAVSRSPRETADGIEERAWSFLWSLDEAAWQRHAVPAIAALRSLPDQERRRDYANRHHLSVYATTGAGT